MVKKLSPSEKRKDWEEKFKDEALQRFRHDAITYIDLINEELHNGQ